MDLDWTGSFQLNPFHTLVLILYVHIQFALQFLYGGTGVGRGRGVEAGCRLHSTYVKYARRQCLARKLVGTLH